MRRMGPRALALGLVATSFTGLEAAAAPCVGDNFERPFPGATEVSTRFVDVPSPRFPGLWQEGRLQGYSYILYANGEATVQDGGLEPQWSISVFCDLENGSCEQVADGTPPAAAVRVATLMGQCFVAPETVDVPPVPEPEPDPVAPDTEGWALVLPDDETDISPQPTLSDTVEEPLPHPALVAEDGTADAEPEPAETQAEEAESEPAEPQPVEAEAAEPAPAQVAAEDPPAPPAPCGLATVPEGTPGATLQRLLVEAGEDPGPIDGFPGRLTRRALIAVLGEDAGNLGTEAAIVALNAHLCQPDPQ